MATGYVARSLRATAARSVATFFRRPCSPVRHLSASSSTSYLRRLFPSFSIRDFSTRRTSSSLNDPNPNWSNRPPKETILLDGCDFEHWLVVMKKPEGDPTRDEIIDSYIKTLAMVVGSEEEARMKIYSVSTRHYFAFGALVSEELSYKLKELPNVTWVLPDSYLDVKNKDYGGEPFIHGQAVPYNPKYHEEWVRNNQRANERNKRNNRPRYSDRSRDFEHRRDMQMSNQNALANVGGPAGNMGGPPNMAAPPPNEPIVASQPNMHGYPNNTGGQSNYGGGSPPNNMGGQPNYGGGMPPRNNGGEANYGGREPLYGGGTAPNNTGGHSNYGGVPPPNLGAQPNYGGGAPPSYVGGQPNYAPLPNIGGQANYGANIPPNIGGQANYGGNIPPHSTRTHPTYGGGMLPNNSGSYQPNSTRGMPDNVPNSHFGTGTNNLGIPNQSGPGLSHSNFAPYTGSGPGQSEKGFTSNVGYGAARNQHFDPNMRPPVPGLQNAYTPGIGGGNPYQNQNVPGRDLPPPTNC